MNTLTRKGVSRLAAKKPYEEPAVQSERVFEALATVCSVTADTLDCVIQDPFVDLTS